jgi:hypothetical protein
MYALSAVGHVSTNRYVGCGTDSDYIVTLFASLSIFCKFPSTTRMQEELHRPDKAALGHSRYPKGELDLEPPPQQQTWMYSVST